MISLLTSGAAAPIAALIACFLMIINSWLIKWREIREARALAAMSAKPPITINYIDNRSFHIHIGEAGTAVPAAEKENEQIL